VDRRKRFFLELGPGVIIGTAAGLLLPPKPGMETQPFVADRPNAIPRQGKKGSSSVERANRQALIR
jgi:gas vesicle protein